MKVTVFYIKYLRRNTKDFLTFKKEMQDIFSRFVWVGMVSYLIGYVPYELLIIPLHYMFGVRVYQVARKEACIKLQKRLTNWTLTSHDGKGYGYSIGYDYYLHLNMTDLHENW